jgi:hypothetical protein
MDENTSAPALYSFLSLIQKMLPFKSCIANFDAHNLHNIWIENAFNWMWMDFPSRLIHPPAQMYLNQGEIAANQSDEARHKWNFIFDHDFFLFLFCLNPGLDIHFRKWMMSKQCSQMMNVWISLASLSSMNFLKSY